MELVLGASIGLVVAVVVAIADAIVRAGLRRPARGSPEVPLAIESAPHDPNSAASTDWIRNTIGAPVGDLKRTSTHETPSQCPVCGAWVVKGAEVCTSCGAIVSSRMALRR